MHRRVFLAAILSLAAHPALAGKLSLDAISRYLNGIEAATARFAQSNDDGSRAAGTLYILRPGRMRFEYDPPVRLLVLAGGGEVGIFDGQSNLRHAERYPLARTPLHLILERNVNLARRDMVVGHDAEGAFTVVTAQDPAHPEYGTIALKFADGPIRLAEWVVTDGQGMRTTVTLGELDTGGILSNFMFDIAREEARRNR